MMSDRVNRLLGLSIAVVTVIIIGACGGGSGTSSGDGEGSDGPSAARPTLTPVPTVGLDASAVPDGEAQIVIGSDTFDLTIAECFVLGGNMAGSLEGDGVTVVFDLPDTEDSKFDTLRGGGSLKVDIAATGASYQAGTDELDAADLAGVDLETLGLHDQESNPDQKYAAGGATMVDLSSPEGTVEATYQLNCA
jgi:hypothetical protein